jgi:mannose-6-phosphate isomerase-like protein (cupin superfamily)
MVKRVIRFFCFIVCIVFYSESINAQTIKAKELQTDSINYENVYVKMLHSDSLSSTFAIWVKNEVKSHKHVNHSEVVSLVQGRAEMTVAGVTRTIKKGDIILIPKGTVHSVVTKSKKPLLVISVQAPKFVGKDRVWVN